MHWVSISGKKNAQQLNTISRKKQHKTPLSLSLSHLNTLKLFIKCKRKLQKPPIWKSSYIKCEFVNGSKNTRESDQTRKFTNHYFSDLVVSRIKLSTAPCALSSPSLPGCCVHQHLLTAHHRQLGTFSIPLANQQRQLYLLIIVLCCFLDLNIFRFVFLLKSLHRKRNSNLYAMTSIAVARMKVRQKGQKSATSICNQTSISVYKMTFFFVSIWK